MGSGAPDPPLAAAPLPGARGLGRVASLGEAAAQGEAAHLHQAPVGCLRALAEQVQAARRRGPRLAALQTPLIEAVIN